MKILKEIPVAISLPGNRYLTAVNHGNIGEKANTLCIHTDATVLDVWEMFTIEKADDTHVAIKTGSGKYLSIKSNNNPDKSNTLPIHTDAIWIRADEIFQLCFLDNGKYALKAPSGNFVTFVNNGNMSECSMQLTTDANSIGSQEKVQFILIVQ